MRVSRSLTIKQMAMVSVVALVTICIFITIQLFHFVDQRKNDYIRQMWSMSHTVRDPLAEAVMNVDIPRAQQLLNSLKTPGILARADVVLPGNVPGLYADFLPLRPVPPMVVRLFDLPVRLSVPLYGTESNLAARQPVAHLVMQIDAYRLYQFILSMLSTMVSAYLLLALVLTVAISWCMNRMLVHPLRALAQELNAMPLNSPNYHQLTLPPLHGDDELGLLVRTYNRNQMALEKAHDMMNRMSTRNPVTDLPNLTLFLPMLEQHLLSARRAPLFSVMLIGISTLQEAMGILDSEQRNRMLKTIVARIKSCMDEGNLLAQINHDRFVVLALDTEQPFEATHLAKRLIAEINQPVELPDYGIRPEANIGIAVCHKRSDEITDARAEVDLLMGQASSALNIVGRDDHHHFLFFEPELAQRARERLTQEDAILHGLKEGHFSLYLQPQLDLRTGKAVGAEALIRWHRQDGGSPLPSVFIPLAEETGGIVPLGEWAMEQVVRILAEWQPRGLRLPLALNVSGVQLSGSRFADHLTSLLEQYAIDATLLHLEVTETARIRDISHAAATLGQLRERGIRVALDDFGMGYAGLNYLQSLPVDIIKIDKSFVERLPQDGSLVRIVNAIAAELSLHVVAEGVETQEQCDWLQQNGIFCVQGYLFAPALPQDEFIRRYLT